MTYRSLSALCCITATAALLAPGAQAQSAPRPSPLDPQAAAPALAHRSALGAFRNPKSDALPLAWREANDNVDRAGGWRALAREATAPDAQASAPAAAAPASAPRAMRPATPAPAHRH